MLFKLLLLKLFGKRALDVNPYKKRYMVECFLYNFYAVVWLAYTIYAWVSWHKHGILFKVVDTIIGIFGIPVGLTDTWSYKKWMVEEKKLKK